MSDDCYRDSGEDEEEDWEEEEGDEYFENGDYEENDEEDFEEEEEEDYGEYEDGDEEDYYDSDEDDEDESDPALELPEIVRDELDRRKADPSLKNKPPNPLAVHALRQYFESGQSDPMVAGGFITLMRELGAVAQSKDHLVKNTEHNVRYFGATGGDTKEWWQDQIERHESEVRLLRYGEYIEMQETKGLSFEKGWKFMDFPSADEVLMGRDSSTEHEEEKDEKKSNSSSVVNDDELTQEQLMALSVDFTTAFWQYANHDKVYHAMAEGVQSHLPGGKVNGASAEHAGTRMLEIQCTEQHILQHCLELRDRYIEQGRPLGPNLALEQTKQATVVDKKLSGKKNRRRQRQQRAKLNNSNNISNGSSGSAKKSHAENVKDYIQLLFQMLQNKIVIRPPSAACARIVSGIMDMLQAAVAVDPDVARCFTSEQPASPGQILLQLRSRALEFALEADQEEESRPKWAADLWWQAYTDLTYLMGDVIMALCGGAGGWQEYSKAVAPPSTPDEKLAAKYFETCVSAPLLESINSKLSVERSAALSTLGRVIWSLPVEVAMGLVKQKSTWNLLEQACQCNNFAEEVQEKKSKKVAATAESNSIQNRNGKLTRADQRERNTAAYSASQATNLLTRLCGKGMIKDDNNTGGPTTGVIPSPLARKMIQRGIVPLLMTLARSESPRVAAEAASGLAQISRVKDCRTILFQHAGGVDLLQDMLASSEGNRVSEGMLLVVHLLWDEEWRDPLLKIEPPIETTAVKWAAYAMQCIRDRADETRIASKKLTDEFMAKSLSQVRLSEGADSAAKAKLEVEIKEMEVKIRRQLAWNKLETMEGHGHITNLTLGRSLLLLSTMLHGNNAPQRVAKANGLALGAACLDVPVDDTNSAAANLIGNYLATAGSVSPIVFPDPDHVVRAAISRLSRLVNRQDMSTLSLIFVRLLNGLRQCMDWAPYFQSCAEQDIEHKYVIEVFLPKIGANIPSTAPPKNPPPGGGRRNNTHRRLQEGGGADKSAKPSGGRANRGDRSFGVPSPCTELTGKLQSCDACGKMETKRGAFMKCSQCKVAKYCGRKCQKNAWKKHKKECPTLAAQKTVGSHCTFKK
jgi:hypothetical protein